MPDTRTFGRYAEIPYDQMTPEQHEGYRLLRRLDAPRMPTVGEVCCRRGM